MGSRGPIGKPPDRQHGHRPREQAVTLAPAASEEPPAPPAGLLQPTVQAWADFWSSPLQALVTASDRPALVRLFCLYDERERAWRGYRRQRLVEGSQGQPVASPLFGVVKALDAEIRALEDRFGCSPAARLRLGVRLGQAARTLDDLTRELDVDQHLEDVRERFRRLRITGVDPDGDGQGA